MPYLPLCALEGFPKNLPQHLIWRGICTQMTPLNTKSEGCIANNCPFEPTVATASVGFGSAKSKQACLCVHLAPHLHPPRAYTCYYEEVASVSSGLHKNASDSID